MSLFEKIKTDISFSRFVSDNIHGETKAVGQNNLRLNPCPLCGANDAFTIREDNHFVCFSCNEKGDLIRFVSKAMGYDRDIDAAKYIAGMYGVVEEGNIKKPEKKISPFAVIDGGGKREERDRAEGVSGDRAYEIREKAAKAYHHNLMNSSRALGYQNEKRMHRTEILEKEMVGLSVGNLIAELGKQKVTVEELESVGLVKLNRSGKGYHEVIPEGWFVYPHRVNGRVAFFSIKDPEKKDAFQIKKYYAPREWKCYGQDAISETEIMMVEGEDDRLSVMDIGKFSACLGFLGNYNINDILGWIKDHAEGKVFYLAFDNDNKKEAAGRKYAMRYARAIINGGGTAKIVPIEKGMDIDDVLREAGHGAGEAKIKEMLSYSREVSLPEKITMGGVYDFSSFEVVGELPDGRVVFWSKVGHRIYRVPLKELNIDQLVQIGQDEVMARVVRTKAEKTEGMLLFSSLKSHLINIAAKKKLKTDKELGQGFHFIEGKWFVVNGDEAFEFDGVNIVSWDKPIYDKRLIDFQPYGKWAEGLEDILRASTRMTVEQAGEVLQELKGILGQWRLVDDIEHIVLTGWILAQFLQSMWYWRPHLWLIGDSGSGKTILNQAIKSIGGELCKPLSGSSTTSAGLRQDLGGDFRLMMIDEFEHCKDQEQLITYMRDAGRGGASGVKGSPQQIARTFKLEHMIMVTSVTHSMERGAELTRFLLINTVKDASIKPKIPGENYFREFRKKVLQYVLWASYRALELINKFPYEEGYQNRQIEALLVPFSMVAVGLEGNPMDTARAMVDRYLDYLRKDFYTEQSDKLNLVNDILNARMRIQYSEVGMFDKERTYTREFTLGQVYFDKNGPGEAAYMDVESVGVKRLDEDWLFIMPSMVEKTLLKNTVWGNLRIRQILKRIPGARDAREYIAGTQQRGVMIPIQYLVEEGLLEGEDDVCTT